MNNQFEISSATGVNLQLNIAGPGARSYAYVIDWHIRVLVGLAWYVVGSLIIVGALKAVESDSPDYTAYLFIVVIPSLVIYWLYHPVLEIAMRGRTPGKRIAGVRILSLDGQIPSVMAHLIRNVLRIIDSLPFAYALGLLVTILTKNSVRIGDLAAGTVLVYESDDRDGKIARPALNPSSVSLYGLEQTELGQELLARWDDLNENKRVELALRLIQQLDPERRPATSEPAIKAQLELLISGDINSSRPKQDAS